MRVSDRLIYLKSRRPSPPPMSAPPPELVRPAGPRPRPRFVTTAQLTTGTLKLIPKLPPDLSCVVGVARSGMLPATVLATALHLPLYALDQERGLVRDVGHGWRLRNHRPRQGTVLVLDDTTGSGRSLRMTKQALGRCARCPVNVARAILASVYCNSDSPLKPDLWAEDLHLPHILEWNFANSIVSQVCAFDLDGVIVHDAESGGQPGTPHYLPRRHTVHIITGRGEKHRVETEALLRRWGVQVAMLTMGPWDECPEWERIADYKAEAVRRFAATAHERPFGPPMYVESCSQQAQRIAERSGVMVVCPATGKVLGPEGCWL